MVVVREVVDTPVILTPVIEKRDHRVEEEEEEEEENETFLESHVDLLQLAGLCTMWSWCCEIDTENILHVSLV